MPKVKVNSLSEFIQQICGINETMIHNGANKHEILLFRGQSSLDYELMPSLGRNRHFLCGISIFNEERNLIELAKFKLPELFRSDLQPIELLALLQHHRIPTRLLDVTESALVALYFACCSNEDNDGEVFAFKTNERDVSNYPIINAVADSYRLVRGTFCSLSLFYGAAVLQPYFLEHKQMCDICNKSDEDGAEWVRECCDKPQFVYAPVRSLRQQLQRGRYIIFPNKIEKPDELNYDCFTSIIESINKDDADIIAGRIIIPKEVKQKIKKELELFGISRETLFADSPDIVCESIVESCKYRVNGDMISKKAE